MIQKVLCSQDTKTELFAIAMFERKKTTIDAAKPPTVPNHPCTITEQRHTDHDNMIDITMYAA